MQIASLCFTLSKRERSLEIWPHIDEFGDCFRPELTRCFFLVHGTQKSRTFCLTSQFVRKSEKAHTFVLFWLFDLVMYSEATLLHLNILENLQPKHTSILRRQVSSQMLKQFGYGETNAVMVRGPLWPRQGELLRKQDLDDLAVRAVETHGPCDVFFSLKMQYCQALSCCRRLCRSHWCCSCCGAGKYFTWLWVRLTVRSWNAAEFPWNPSLWPGWWVQQSSCWVCWWQCYLVTPGDNKK